MALGNLFARLERVYDRMLAVGALLLLVGSLGYLAWNVGTVRTAQERFLRNIENMPIRHPEAAAIDVKAYEEALASVQRPLQVQAADWTYSMFVPEIRVWCVDCYQPIDYLAETCVFCGARQPIDREQDPGRDTDGDGMPDEWEIAHGFDPRDPADAHQDADGDGFTNIEEYLAGTDPLDPKAHPPYAVKLCLERIREEPFDLLFKSVIRLPENQRQFAINTRTGDRTYFVRLGQDIEGFVVHRFEPHFREVDMGGVRRRVDVSVLTLKRGDKEIPLQMGRDVQYREYTAYLRFAIDDTRLELAMDDRFTLVYEEYDLVGMEPQENRVRVRRRLDDKAFDVPKCASDERSGDGAALQHAPTGPRR